MQINHEIVYFNAVSGAILVRYFCDEVPEGLLYNLDVPIENGAFVGQDEVNILIEHMKPVGQLTRIAEVKGVQVPDYLANLPQQIQAAPDNLAPIRDDVVAVLREFGLIP